jgi:hypothetical protein
LLIGFNTMSKFQLSIQEFIFIAGLAQVALTIGSLIIPRILKWRSELAKVRPLIKQMFWTYATYIFVINVCLGLISIFDFRELAGGSRFAILITGFIAAYWISRVLIQFFYFDRQDFPKGVWNLAGEFLLVALFVFLSVVYSWACYSNFKL